MQNLFRRRLVLKLAVSYFLTTAAVVIVAMADQPPFVWLFFLILLIFLISAFLSSAVISPLDSIARSVSRFAGGDLRARAESISNDEIGDLAGAFNSMAGLLEGKIHELEASKSQIEGILESMTEGVLVVSPVGGLLRINSAAMRILEIGAEFRPGRPLAELIRQPGILALVDKILRTGQQEVTELELFSPAGIVLQARGTVWRSPELGLCALVVLHDISDLKRLEQVRKDFVANVSHELKTPLAAIQGAVETLLDGGALQDKDRGRPFVEAVAEESARLLRLVEDLLVLARVESRQNVLAKEPVELKEFLQAEISRRSAQAKAAQVSVRLEFDTPLLTLYADPGQLGHAVGNLLDNAIKYNRPGGTVTVRASVKEGNYLIEVEDTGIGIPPDGLARVFERFYRIDKARSRETGGTGLGLSIVKHVMDAHGGSVRVDSRLGEGTRFSLLFPLS